MRWAITVAMLVLVGGCTERSIDVENQADRQHLPRPIRASVITALAQSTPESVTSPRLVSAMSTMWHENGVAVAWWWIERTPPMRSFVIRNEITGRSQRVNVSDHAEQWRDELEVRGEDALVHYWGVLLPLDLVDATEDRDGSLTVAMVDHDQKRPVLVSRPNTADRPAFSAHPPPPTP